MEKIYLILFFLIKVQISSFNDISNNNYCKSEINGCLSCKDNFCLLCDIYNGYFLDFSGNNCNLCQNNTKNCTFSLKCGTCQVCKNNYTLCTGSCIKNQKNCLVGTCDNNCKICNKNYFLNHGVCTKVTKIVDNCKEYKSLKNCKACIKGYSLKLSNGIYKCIASLSLNIRKNSENCFVNWGNTFYCDSCIKKKSIIFYKYSIINPYLTIEKKLLNMSSDLEKKISEFSSFDMFSKLINKNDICTSKTILNCDKVDSSLNCIKCFKNYFLSNGICLKIPEEKETISINNCIKYEIRNKALFCTNCKSNFYLKEEICQKYTKIEGCLEKEYDPEKKICNKCDILKGFKLDNNKCIKILNFNLVENCTNYNINGSHEGKCNECKQNYILNNNTCITIENCKNINSSINPLICNQCNEDYKPNTNNQVCEKIPLASGCLLYNESNCITCKANNFLNSNICTNQRNKRTYKSNCSKGKNNWFCEECNPNHIKVPKIYECMNPIPNCLLYNNTNNQCILCGNNKTGNNCSNNGNDNNCNLYMGNICVGCNINYYLKNNVCSKATVNNSSNICSNNKPDLNQNLTNSVSSVNNFNYICDKCIVETFVPDTILTSRNRCVPRLSLNSDNPYSEGNCNGTDIQVTFNKGNGVSNVLTCRSIKNIIGTRYESDLNCAIYKNTLTDYIDYNTSSSGSNKTLCAICNPGYTFSETTYSRCEEISNCLENNNIFGGCKQCKDGFSLDLSGFKCVATIPNCKVILGNDCLKCNDTYYGRLDSNGINYKYDSTGFSVLLGYSNDYFETYFRNTENVQIIMTRFFYFSSHGSQFRFSGCSNIPLKGSNKDFTESSGNIIESLNDRTLAVNGNNDFPSFCRAGNYMKYFTNTNSYICSPILGSYLISHLPYNNFLNQVISKKCNFSKLIILRGLGGGPFCYVSRFPISKTVDPIQIYLPDVNLCEVFIATMSKSNEALNRNCIKCAGTSIFNPKNTECSVPVVETNKSIPCLKFSDINNNENICIECPLNYSIVNNACIASNQLLSGSSNKTISEFISENNCNKLNWGVVNPGVTGNIFTSGNYNPTCLICNDNFVMNYTTLTCVSPNLFNFKNCRTTQSGLGCINCNSGYINFGANIEHKFCISLPSDDKFIGGHKVSRCSTYRINGNMYECINCNSGYILSNNTCIVNNTNKDNINNDNKNNDNINNGTIANCKTFSNSNTCEFCENTYYLHLNKCIKGNIYQCLEYKSQYICSKCNINYTLWGNRNDKIVGNYVACINTQTIKESLGSSCKEVKSMNNDSMDLYCTCEKDNIPLKSESINDSICLPNYIDNCIKYDNNNLTQCIECYSDFIERTKIRKNDMFILDTINNICKPRTQTQKLLNCQVYSLNEIKCQTCLDGYYKTSKMTCEKNPDEEKINCKFLSSDGICKLCNKDFYPISNKECVKLTKDSIISNCYKYNNKKKCILCNKGYLINLNNTCDILSDSTFLDPYNYCKYHFLTGYLNKKCICKKDDYYFDSKSKQCMKIPNCTKSNSNGTCSICSPGMHFNKNNICISVNKFIDNCKYYLKNGICSQCKENYGLINNKCLIIPYEDRVNNCDKYNYGTKCLLCNPGYFNFNGDCQKFEDKNIYFSLSNNKNLGLICKPGTQMNKNRKCILNNKINIINEKEKNKYILIINMTLLLCLFTFN